MSADPRVTVALREFIAAEPVAAIRDGLRVIADGIDADVAALGSVPPDPDGGALERRLTQLEQSVEPFGANDFSAGVKAGVRDAVAQIRAALAASVGGRSVPPPDQGGRAWVCFETRGVWFAGEEPWCVNGNHEHTAVPVASVPPVDQADAPRLTVDDEAFLWLDGHKVGELYEDEFPAGLPFLRRLNAALGYPADADTCAQEQCPAWSGDNDDCGGCWLTEPASPEAAGVPTDDEEGRRG